VRSISPLKTSSGVAIRCDVPPEKNDTGLITAEVRNADALLNSDFGLGSGTEDKIYVFRIHAVDACAAGGGYVGSHWKDTVIF